MNYDTVLPERLRTQLKRKVNRKPLKLFYKITVVLLLFAGLRHLNTVPHREWKRAHYTGGSWSNAVYTPTGLTEDSVYTTEELFGSSYRGIINGEDIGISSKEFKDILKMIPR